MPLDVQRARVCCSAVAQPHSGWQQQCRHVLHAKCSWVVKIAHSCFAVTPTINYRKEGYCRVILLGRWFNGPSSKTTKFKCYLMVPLLSMLHRRSWRHFLFSLDVLLSSAVLCGVFFLSPEVVASPLCIRSVWVVWCDNNTENTVVVWHSLCRYSSSCALCDQGRVTLTQWCWYPKCGFVCWAVRKGLSPLLVALQCCWKPRQ